MPISFKCKRCDKAFQVADKLAGKKVRCLCGEMMVVPARTPAVKSGGGGPPPRPGASRQPPDLFAAASSDTQAVASGATQSSASHIDLFGSTESAGMAPSPSLTGPPPPLPRRQPLCKSKSLPPWAFKTLLIGGLSIAALGAVAGLGVLIMKMMPNGLAVNVDAVTGYGAGGDRRSSRSTPSRSMPSPSTRSSLPATSSGPGPLPTYAKPPILPLRPGQAVVLFNISGYSGSGDPTRAAMMAVVNSRQSWADPGTAYVDVENHRIVVGVKFMSVSTGPVKVALQRAGFTVGATGVRSKGL